MKLEKIETQLQALLEQEKRQWTRTAQLLIEIERDSLFFERAKSFSQYVRQLSEQFQIQESNFWRIKKAGEYYLKLHDTDDVQIIEQAKTTPEQVEILAKIRTAAPSEVVQSLEKRMVDGETTRQELRDVWQTYRPLKEGKTERGRKPNNLPPDVAPPVQSQSAKVAMTTVNILEALKNLQWAIDTVGVDTDCSRLFTEVAVTAGSSRYPRRIDVVSIVRHFRDGPLPTIIGVEIKADVNDLKRETKLTEYMPFCHYFYLAFPNETAFINAAKAVTTQQIGLLCVTDEIIDGRYQVVMLRKARRSQKPHPALMGELYAKCLCQALDWIGEN